MRQSQSAFLGLRRSGAGADKVARVARVAWKLSDARLRHSALVPCVHEPQSQWMRTLDLPGIFRVAEEYASYTKTESACRQAVDRLPTRQRDVIQQHYYEAMTQPQIAAVQGVADSTIRNTHAGALRNLRRDDELFDVLEAVGKVRDRARRLERGAAQNAA